MRLLLVEDDKKLTGYLRKGLIEESYSVDVAYTGLDGIEAVRNTEYDLIILDVLLPGKSGIDVCRQIRSRGAVTPVIMLTAKDQVEAKVAGLDAGADDYLSKPFSFDELLARIRALLRRTQNYKTPVLKAADLELDPGAHKVSRAGREIELTGKEYALLEYLLRNKGRIVTETNILEHVWEMQADPFTNVVSVYIHYLRKKVDRGFDRTLIHTIRSIGYTIRDDDADKLDPS
jgi:DNA-binding response OmpR family regulator